MEFYSLGFLTGISVNVFNFDYFRNILNNANNSLKLINFYDVDQLLLEEFVKTGVTLFSEFGIFFEIFLHLDSQHMNQMLGS